MSKKQQFLEEHNRLSSPELRADLTMLTHFREDKINIFKNDDWDLDRLRRPFIMWLTSLSDIKKEELKIEEQKRLIS
ncbi:MAG: hypothetical protein A2312_04065 [Candidatus Staskawiczbacteria bacterium RIFOXYB2_FULL_32_9]|uniref:Uncharacterized protein n=1 Tax=Candidatus Staskawiczbacteria bacterium RIFOXYD1_FULL_32_13 TaxID=1802234 RepID=A0A1G2JLV6_9BACT|nr:MAG: hypothetical protein UR22_C0011G0011 [Parcubacteria group bacterium GW2011_GWC2_32_10]OGZ77910.1 MAG: hypothetical protein A2360_00060 [Candidatus Staskawiczbacteria bacterium RIFOXYB1_FULL_32_11]OGZ84172.1 MAG: hypothetical protein A2312_04065 [Candidatus Staskawiczbacteria bacterium RIFOXYB2_FULL_32_9]OGZ87777.1 MAG: hypothetical protein A2463_02585 [Candidatus Staskawiczbacteria bacterium RIFOXYC2_FULL_32_10]OGZ88126.1 MAG: hypothetical protein A2561_01455 [Candidatus Staskawiczbacte